MKPTLAILLSLALLGSIAAARAADRLSFGYHAPALHHSAFPLLTNGSSFYPVSAASNAPFNVLPIASVSGLPLGALRRQVWAYLLYPRTNASQHDHTMRQYLFASGAVRFYRGGVKVGELPYQSGSYWPSVTNSEACLSQPRLWNEIGDFAAAGYGHSYWGSTAPVDPTRALVIECDVAGTNFPLGLSSQTVLADCDRITFEIDRLEFPSSTWAMAWTGSNTCNAIVPFLAVLSQPATR